MRQADTEVESWKRMVLGSMPEPAWLSGDAPQSDVILSSRSRVMRNLRGHRFPHASSPQQLQEVMATILKAARAALPELVVHKGLTNAERDYLVGSRLISPDFAWNSLGRALLLNDEQSLSLMINEEDHLRVQALTAGWSIDTADALSASCLDALDDHLDFAWSPAFGFLSASPYNAGTGRRLSTMFHLIGLAQSKRLPSVLRALTSKGIAARGLFGESSRAIGAFVQVSVLSGTRSEFVGACEYLMREERDARTFLGRTFLEERVHKTRDFSLSSPAVSLADALRTLAWVRWAASAEHPAVRLTSREVDTMLTRLELRGSGNSAENGRQRANFLRQAFGA